MFVLTVPETFELLPEREEGDIEHSQLISAEEHSSTTGPRRETDYIDGLRGIAAFIVYTSHFSLPYQPHLEYGFGNRDNHSFLQLPIVRLIHSGPIMVALFFVVSGFVLSLKPWEHNKRGEAALTLRTLSSSTFRRLFRLFFPTVISTFLVMLSVRLRLYDIHYESFALDYVLARPRRLISIWDQFYDWAMFILFDLTNPWHWGPSPKSVDEILSWFRYGDHLWTIPVEFQCSMVLFLAIIGLLRLRQTFRLIALSTFFCYCLWWSRWDVALFLAGSGLAEVHQARSKSTISYINKIVSCIIFALGLYIASIPTKAAQDTPGYVQIMKLDPRVRTWHTLAAVLILWSLEGLLLVKTVLTTPLAQYLGEISFSLYIVHEPCLQLFGWAAVPAVWDIIGKEKPWKYQMGFLLAYLITTPVLLWVADTYWRIVDKNCVQVARWLEAKLTGWP